MLTLYYPPRDGDPRLKGERQGFHSQERTTQMKKMLAVVVLLLSFAVASFAGDNAVSWSRVVGVITSPGVSNLAAGIPSGTTPWTTSDGSVTVDSTGGVAVLVEGLGLRGGTLE